MSYSRKSGVTRATRAMPLSRHATRPAVSMCLLVSPAPRWMRPNSYVQVSFTRQASKVLLVPSEAVVTDDLKSIVFVYNPKTKKLEHRPVALGKQGKDLTEITGGLHAGEVVVAKGAILLLNEVNP